MSAKIAMGANSRQITLAAGCAVLVERGRVTGVLHRLGILREGLRRRESPPFAVEAV